jgi:Concanavalin A-like lectin/glucanases superfamily
MRKFITIFAFIALCLSGNAQVGVADPGVYGSASSGPTPVEQWLMNEGSGQTFLTSSSSGDNLIGSNITWAAVAGFPGLVPVFNGSNTSATGVNQTNTNFTGLTPFSISMWVLVSTLGEQGTMLSAFDGSDHGYEVSLNGPGTTIGLQMNSSSGALIILTTTQPSAGVIHNIAATYNGSQSASGAAIYLDGVLQSVSVFSDNLAASIANAQPVVVGSRSNGTEFFSGNMADLRIYNVQLTSSQVSAIFAAGPQ